MCVCVCVCVCVCEREKGMENEYMRQRDGHREFVVVSKRKKQKRVFVRMRSHTDIRELSV